MVRTPIQPAAGETAAHAEYRNERKNLIVRIKRESKPTHRLRTHIVPLAADGHRPAHIARVLYRSRATVDKIPKRFAREAQSAFDDHKRRGSRPLLDELANERIERLVEEESPTKQGWLLSPELLLLMINLFKERALLVGREMGTAGVAEHHGVRERRLNEPDFSV